MTNDMALDYRRTRNPRLRLRQGRNTVSNLLLNNYVYHFGVQEIQKRYYSVVGEYGLHLPHEPLSNIWRYLITIHTNSLKSSWQREQSPTPEQTYLIKQTLHILLYFLFLPDTGTGGISHLLLLCYIYLIFYFTDETVCRFLFSFYLSTL